MRSHDARVAVIGTGTMGSMALWRLTRRSGDVIGFDSQHPGTDRSAVGGDTRLFRIAYREGAAFHDLLRLSEQMYHELNAEGFSALQQIGSLAIGPRDGDYISDLLESITQSGSEHRVLEHHDLAKEYPQHGLLPEDIGVFDPRGGVIRTDEAVLGAVNIARSSGAEVQSGCEVREVISHPDGVEIVTDDESRFVETAVVTAGAWSPGIVPADLRSALSPQRIALTWFLARNPEEFAPDRFPIFVRESGGVHLYGAPTVDNATVKVAGMFSETPASPMSLERTLSAEESAVANDAIDRFFPGLYPSYVRADTYPDLYTADKRPVIGRLPETPNVLIATGFSGRGFKMASGVGEVIARDVFGEDSTIDLGFVNPARLLQASR